jgi:uracil-DNA glycosylase family 4
VTIPKPQPGYDADCRECPRLARFLDAVRREHPDYHARPVAPFGPRRAALLVVGLAPGMHGANRTGRPFTGDHAGILLYQTLHKFGFADRAGSGDSRDGMKLIGCRVTNAVKCLPPQNKPQPDEVRRCNRYLAGEIAAVRPRALLALGAIAHRAVLMAFGLKPGPYRFAHHAVHWLPPVTGAEEVHLYDSYHCSRYNTQTRRLTTPMFEAVFRDIFMYLNSACTSAASDDPPGQSASL